MSDNRGFQHCPCSLESVWKYAPSLGIGGWLWLPAIDYQRLSVAEQPRKIPFRPGARSYVSDVPCKETPCGLLKCVVVYGHVLRSESPSAAACLPVGGTGAGCQAYSATNRLPRDRERHRTLGFPGLPGCGKRPATPAQPAAQTATASGETPLLPQCSTPF